MRVPFSQQYIKLLCLVFSGMPCVAFADFVTKMTYDKCQSSGSGKASCNPRPIFQPVFDGMSDRADVDAVVEKGASLSLRHDRHLPGIARCFILNKRYI